MVGRDGSLGSSSAEDSETSGAYHREDQRARVAVEARAAKLVASHEGYSLATVGTVAVMRAPVRANRVDVYVLVVHCGMCVCGIVLFLLLSLILINMRS